MEEINSQRPLLVDLDGSLLKTDTLFELLLLTIKSNIFYLFLIPFWLLKGKSFFKKSLFERVKLDVINLPYNEEVILFLQKQHNENRRIILCSGTWHKIAEEITAHFNWIDEYKATDDTINLTGTNKKRWAVETYGLNGYDYLGNSNVDIVVWNSAHSAIVVGQKHFIDKCKKQNNIKLESYIELDGFSLGLWLKALRIHQWAKNGLLFIPIFTAHKFNEYDLIINTILAFVAFGVCASATYIINDLLDLEADRAHDTKKYRPFASGNLSLKSGITVSILMLLTSMLIGYYVGIAFFLVLVIYIFVTILYSLYLKRLQTVDVITLASLFTIRVIAGAAAINVMPTFWLLSFSMFIFLSLALVKRVAELIKTQEIKGESSIVGRGYFTADIIILQSLGGASGLIAVLVFALYINSNEVIEQYTYPQVLWLMCPILGYWIMRVWMLVARNQMDQDPIFFAIKDRNSWYAAVLAGIVFMFASWF
jgi:4-hydroxybenzoate polyprenyltransferase